MKLLPTVLTAVAVAVVPASAFLLPPDTGVNIANLHTANANLVLDCPGCPFAVGEKDGQYVFTTEAVENSLLMNFTLSPTGDKILLNDRVFHPMEFPDLHAFYAPQVRNSDLLRLTSETVSVRLGYALEQSPHETVEGQDWFNLLFTVFDLAGRQVHIDTIKLKYTFDKNGNIPIVTIDTIPVDAPGSPSAIGMDCKNSLCRMREMIIAKIKQAMRKVKEAAEKAKNSKPAAWVKGCHNKFKGGRPHHQGRPHHGKPHPNHRPHNHEHNHMRTRIQRLIRAIVIPVILGIAAGAAAGALGVLVGHAVVFLWIKFARGGRRGPYSRVAQQEEAIVEEEKEGLMTEAPPGYEELEAVTIPEEKK